MIKDNELNLLKSRAKILAEERKNIESDEPSIDVTLFKEGNRVFAVELFDIEEVLPLGIVTPLPGTPTHILGMINIRGRIVALNNLRVLIDIPNESEVVPTHGVVLASGTMELALAADSLIGVTALKVSSLRPPPVTMASAQKKYVRGVTTDQIILLDSTAILSCKSLIVEQSDIE